LWFCTKLPQDVFNKLEEVSDKFSRGELTGQKRSKKSAISMPDCLLSKEGLGSYVSATKGPIFEFLNNRGEAKSFSVRIALTQLNRSSFHFIFQSD